jgi:hypothetical protein
MPARAANTVKQPPGCHSAYHLSWGTEIGQATVRRPTRALS